MSKKDEALKLALEALNRNDYLGWQTNIHVREAIREALAEQPAQQEPVAFLGWYDNAHWGNEDFKAGCRRAWNAALAQRTWVGLTDEDKHYLNDVLNLQGRFPVIDAIEAKLRSKNEDRN